MPDADPDASALERIVRSVAACAVERSAGEPPTITATARELLLEAAPGARIHGSPLRACAPPPRLAWIVESLPDGGSQGVALAATLDGVVVAAAVIDLSTGVSYSAHTGGGARLDDERIQPAPGDRLAGATIAEGDVPALMMCRVARGSLDGCVHRGPVGPSALAGAHIAEEAGALVELPCPENADLLLAAAPRLFEELREQVTASR